MNARRGRRDDLHPLGLVRLLQVLKTGRARSSTLLGLHEDLAVFTPADPRLVLTHGFRLLETPVGVAAGPHTQLSQNLVAAWLSGARWLELKTVQVLDELDVARPCIDMTDAGFNCEWSQELSLDASFGEYVDAWCAIRILQHEAGAYDPDEPGFACDLSVGYDLAGITGAKMQRFLDRAADVRGEVETRLAAARAVYAAAGDIVAPAALADSVTLSTMHGCPPAEIERIARFLLVERGLDVAVKLNPTLLGPHALRELLHGRLGWGMTVPDGAFDRDPDFASVVDIVRALRDEARRVGRRFGVKLANTLPCVNPGDALPEAEAVRYLSGRALHPVAVAAAARLQEAFAGGLDISFAGGADALNAPHLLRCGLRPVTACSDLLRPGGTLRLRQYLETIGAALDAAGAADLDGLVTGGRPLSREAAALDNLRGYAELAARDPRYRGDLYRDRSIRTGRRLTAFDCVAAPCVGCCPTGQDIPGYLHHAARGEFAEAFGVVRADNPLPVTAGMVCDHPCQQKCTRVNYEAPVRIRDVKRFLSRYADRAPEPGAAEATGRRVAVIGAGPAGLACAHVLARAGVTVEIFEARDQAGGMVTDVIPRFRLQPGHFARDLARIEELGVRIHYGQRVDTGRFRQLREAFDGVFVAVGAQADRKLGLPGEDLPGVEPALSFLAAARRDPGRRLDGVTVVIGGGNSAMDAARTAVRQAGTGAEVHLVYRRTAREMPADPDELRAVRAEGVTVHELRAPAAVEARGTRLALVCDVMRLGEADASGRPRPEPVAGVRTWFPADRIVPATGQTVVCDFVDPSLGEAARDDAARGLGGVWLGGDMRHGPADLVTALGDGRRAAEAMLRGFGLPVTATTADRSPLPEAARQDQAARLVPPHRPAEHRPAEPGDFSLAVADLDEASARAEAARCLACDLVCDVCVSVCPNRANVSWTTGPVRRDLVAVLPADGGFSTVPDGVFAVRQARQTLHVADFCNHCGNCTTFCPTAGQPFLDKPRFALGAASWAAEDDIHRLERTGDGVRLRRRRGGRVQTLTLHHGTYVWETDDAVAELDAATFAVRRVRFLRQPARGFTLRDAAAMAVLLDALARPGDSSWLVT